MGRLELLKTYLRQGWSVLPVKPGEKKPAIDWTEYQNRLPTIQEWMEWLKKFPDCGLGMVTGKISGVTVVDVDKANALPMSIQTSTVKTGRKDAPGLHHYFQYTDKVKTGVGVISGVDIRNDMSFVVLPPSIHESGDKYEWVITEKPKLMPDYLIEKLKKNDILKQKGFDWVAEALTTMSNGNRNSTLTQVAGKLLRSGMNLESIFTLLSPHARQSGVEDLELRKIVNSVGRYQDKHQTNLEFQGPEAFHNITETLWLVQGLIPYNSISFIQGDPKSTKSWVALDIALCVSMGLPLGSTFATKQERVLYLQLEDSINIIAPRYHALIDGHVAAPSSEFFKVYFGSGLKFDSDVAYSKLCEVCEEYRPRLIVVDTLATSHTKDENNASDMSRVINRFKELRNNYKVTILIVHHLRKDNGGVRSMRGSSVIHASAEAVLTVEHDQTTGTSNVMTVTKANHTTSWSYQLQQVGKGVRLHVL